MTKKTKLNKVHRFRRNGEVEILPLQANGGKVSARFYEGKYTREQIAKIETDMSNQAKALGHQGMISVALFYTDVQDWRAGYFTKLGEPIHMYTHSDSPDNTHADPEFYPRFVIYFTKTGPSAGGCDGYFNDCFWEILDVVLGKDQPWETPAELKLEFGVERTAPIDISLMPKIEDRLLKNNSTKLNIFGDHTYISTSNKLQEIKIKLVDGHFKLSETHREKLHGISPYVEKKLLMYKFDDSTTPSTVITYNAFDSLKEITISKEQFKEIKKKPRFGKYLLIEPENRKHNNKEKTPFTLAEEWEATMKEAIDIKEKTNSFINPFKTGCDVNSSIVLFDHFTKHITPNIIEQHEAIWLSEAIMGALIKGENGYKGEAHKADFVSFYPSIMASDRKFFPIKPCVFKIITQEEFDKPVQIGIYRCIIDYNPKFAKLFSWNRYNKYFYPDIQMARTLGMQTKIIIDAQPNFAHYRRQDCLTGSQYFGKFVKYLFKLKKRGVTKAKTMINCLWGKLGRKIYKTLDIRANDTKVSIIKPNSQFISIKPRGIHVETQKHVAEYINNERMYDSSHARIAGFVTAYGRQLIATTMLPHIENIIRWHTDSIFSKIKLPIPYGTELGQLKYYGKCENYKITHVNLCEGKFIL